MFCMCYLRMHYRTIINTAVMMQQITDVMPIVLWKFSELGSVFLFALIQRPHIMVEMTARTVINALIRVIISIQSPLFWFGGQVVNKSVYEAISLF